MADETETREPFTALIEAQAKMVETVFGPMLSANPLFTQFSSGDETGAPAQPLLPGPELATEWMRAQGEWWRRWTEAAGGFGTEATPEPDLDPAAWFNLAENWTRSWLASLDSAPVERQRELAENLRAVWQQVMEATGGDEPPVPDALPYRDRRFADPAWRAQPVFALLHQTYLWLGEQIEATIAAADLPEAEARRLGFAARAMHDALSPANFPAANPVVLKKTLESSGQNLAVGMRNLVSDLQRGQLTHTDPEAFELGRNLATTPGKVVHETPLWQLIQYTPTTA